jgi:hypothetical protein
VLLKLEPGEIWKGDGETAVQDAEVVVEEAQASDGQFPMIVGIGAAIAGIVAFIALRKFR